MRETQTKRDIRSFDYLIINKLLNNHAGPNSAERIGKLMANNQDQTKLGFSAQPQKVQSLMTIVQSAFFNLQSANVRHRVKLS